MFPSTGKVVGISLAMSSFALIVALAICLPVMFLVIKRGSDKRIDEMEKRLKSTIFDVNVQHASIKEVDDLQENYMKKVLLSRIQAVEKRLNVNVS